MTLTKAKALVTGASSGLGAQIATALAGEGATVAIGYRSGEDRAQQICDRIVADGGAAFIVRMDQADPESVERGVAEAIAQLGGLDVLVNNAGMATGGHQLPAGDLDAFTPEIWDEMMAVNVRGPYLVARAAASALREARGRIVNIGSTIGHGTWQAAAPYAPSKGAVASLTRYLAAALAPDVSVNCVAPGLIEGTGMSGAAPESYVESWRNNAVSGRTTSIDDAARHVVAFCSSSTVTGQVLVVDGGVHFR